MAKRRSVGNEEGHRRKHRRSQEGESTESEECETIDGSEVTVDDDNKITMTQKEFDEQYEDHIRSLMDSAKKKEGHIAKSGIIHSIHMYNFMCHRNLSFEFDPRVNMIVGQNGSGKSAALSALTLALGGKASRTGRGNGFRHFVKEGESRAEIVLKLKNEGEDAYKHDVYGDLIVIVRSFTRTGSSTLKIYPIKGKVVSTKRAELSAICDCFNIQVDNPMNVLTQDAARVFLNTSTSKEKYEFFLKGTQLSQLGSEYQSCLENITRTGMIVEHKMTTLADLRQAYYKARVRLEEAEKARKQREEVDTLERERLWAHYEVAVAESKKRVDDVAKCDQVVEKAQEASDTAKTSMQAAEDKVVEIEAELTGIEDEQNIHDEQDSVQAEINANKKGLSELRSSLDEMKRSLTEADDRLKAIDKSIETETNKLKEHTQAKRAERYRAIEAAKDEIGILDRQVKETEERLRELEVQKGRIGQTIDETRRERAQLETHIRQYREAVQNCDKQSQDKTAAFVKNAQQVSRRISSQRWYGETPIGPLGAFVTLADAKWSNIMRTHLGSLMQAFAVTDARDRHDLKEILNQTQNGRATVIVARVDLFDYTRGEPALEYLTVLRALKITNEYVKRILINQSKIERTVLALTRAEGQILVDRLPGEATALTADLYRVQKYNDGGAASTPLPEIRENDVRQQMFTTEDPQAQKQHWLEKIRGAEQNIESIDSRLRNENAEQEARSMEIQQCRNTVRPLLPLREKARLHHQTLLKAQDYDVPVNITVLEAEKIQLESERVSTLRQFEGAEEKKQELLEAQRPLKARYQELRLKLQEIDEQRSVIRSKLEEAALERIQAENAAAHYKRKVDEAQKKREGLDKQRQEAEEEVARKLGQLEQHGFERVEQPRSVKELNRLITAKQKEIRESEGGRRPVSIEQLEDDVMAARQKYDAASKEVVDMGQLNQTMKGSVTERTTIWELFRLHIALRTKIHFQNYLSKRSFYGKVLFDHQKHELDIRVQTDEQAQTKGKDKDKDPKSLSGGEKSFSTICLLLALWEAIGSPIRCLDEFDVFMDAINRGSSTKLMIDAALASDGKQFIFITPQDVSHIALRPGVKIHRMPDPDRAGGRRR